MDDDQAIAEVAAAVLVDGYEVVAAGQAEEGLRMVGSEQPDLVLVDLDLPGGDPVQLLARLREAAVADLPVLVMSASDDRHTRDRAAAAGATGADAGRIPAAAVPDGGPRPGRRAAGNPVDGAWSRPPPAGC